MFKAVIVFLETDIASYSLIGVFHSSPSLDNAPGIIKSDDNCVNVLSLNVCCNAA